MNDAEFLFLPNRQLKELTRPTIGFADQAQVKPVIDDVKETHFSAGSTDLVSNTSGITTINNGYLFQLGALSSASTDASAIIKDHLC